MMIRPSLLLKCAATLALASLASTAALSDVLELDAGGARWVAGGPVTAAPEMPSAIPAPEQRNFAQLIAQLPTGTTGARPSFSPLARAAVTSNFGYRNHPISGGRKMHGGIDLSAPEGTPVYATAMGVVTGAGWYGGYGLLIQLEHADQFQTRYGHLSRLAVSAGQIVEPGELIGYVGSTGRSTGPHLHYEVRLRGTAIDPVPYMRGQ